jgi:hypothetical protein
VSRRFCIHCKILKKLTLFPLRKRGPGGGRIFSCKKCTNRKKKYLKTPRGRWYVRQQNLRHKFGITIKQRNQMLQKQNHRCYICKKSENVEYRGKRLRLSIDHDHRTGKVRHLLCGSCNRVIGQLERARAVPEKYVKYIRSHKSGRI